MFSKLITKMHAMTWKDWLVVGLWLLTFAMLLAFVIAAATIDKHAGQKIVHVKAQTKVIHAGHEFNTQSHTFDTAWTYATGAGKDATGHVLTWKPSGTAATPIEGAQAVHTLIAYDKIVKGVSYDSALAALGFTFMISIFSALGTTVAFKFLERKRGAK